MDEPPDGDTPWVKGGPVGSADALIVGCWWLMREIEVSALDRGEVTVDVRLKRAELRLSCSSVEASGASSRKVFGSDGPARAIRFSIRFCAVYLDIPDLANYGRSS